MTHLSISSEKVDDLLPPAGGSRPVTMRYTSLEAANTARSRRAAAATCDRVRRALHALGEGIPNRLRDAGLLRLQHPEATLLELGERHSPPLSKDAVAGRLRRLVDLEIPPNRRPFGL